MFKRLIKRKEIPGPIDVKGDIISFLQANRKFFIDFELKSINKAVEDTEKEFDLGYRILDLKLKEVFENSSKLIIIPPKYEFWSYLFLSIKFAKLGYRVSFLYYGWAKDIISRLQQYTNYLDYSNFKFEDIDNFEVDLNENPYVINFSDTYKGIKTTVPTFSTVYITKEADLDLATEYIVNHAFSFAGLKKSNLKRVIVETEISESFINKLKSKLALGNQFNKTLIKSEQTSKQFQEIVSEAISDGAEILIGDGIISPDKTLENVVLLNVTPDMQVYQKKFYGPLLAIVDKGEFELEKLFRQQPSNGIVIFCSEGEHNILALPEKYIYASRYIPANSTDDKVLSDHPSLEYLLKFLKN